MNRKPAITSLILNLILTLVLTSCNLPTITPPPDYLPTDAPTATNIVPPTALPATTTPALSAVMISSTNASLLSAANKAPANNVQALNWSSDSGTLSVISQNLDANGVSSYSVSLLEGSSLNVKTVWLAPDGGQITQVAPDGRVAAVVSADMSAMNLYDLGDNARNIVSISPGYTIGGVTFSPDGKYFTVTNYDNMSVSLHSLPDGSEVKILSGFTTAASNFNAGFAGNSVDVVWHARATIQLQNIDSGTLGSTFNHEDSVSDYQVSPDGKILASTSMKTINGNPEPVVILWDTASGAEMRTLQLTLPGTKLSFSPDGTLLAVATGSNIQIWNVASGTPAATLTGHAATVHLVAFSPDGKSLASTGEDNQLILWQVLQ